jgi:hypothetical protein
MPILVNSFAWKNRGKEINALKPIGAHLIEQPVILSEVAAAHSAAATQSKDPYPHPGCRNLPVDFTD